MTMKGKFYFMAVLMMGLTFTACSSDNNDNEVIDHQFNIVKTTP